MLNSKFWKGILILFLFPALCFAYDPQAKQIAVNTTAFNHNLNATDTTVQKALEKLDDLVSLSGVNVIGDLADVDLTGLLNNQVLVYNQTSSTWVPQNYGGGGGGTGTGNVVFLQENGVVRGDSSDADLTMNFLSPLVLTQAGTTTLFSISDATTSTKGIASYNTDMFSVSSGAVSLSPTYIRSLISGTSPIVYNNLTGTIGIGSGTIGATELASTTVVPGTYYNTQLTIDADGRITSANTGTSELGAPTNATYITQTPNPVLTEEQALSVLSTGLMKSTTSTGVISTVTDNSANWNDAYTWRLLGASGTSPLTLTLSANQLTGSISQASSVANGYLSLTDWNTFNNKLSTTLPSANIWVGNATAVATAVAMSGDVAISNTGATTIQANSVALSTDTTGNYVANAQTTAPLQGGSTGSEGASLSLSITKANATTDGYLNATDWSTFNNKLSSSWAGSSNITTLGTITTGIWNGTTIAVPRGGTGSTAFNTYGLVLGGTTTTGALQSLANGPSGSILSSLGTSATPQWINSSNSSVLVTNATGVPSFSTTLPNGINIGNATATALNITGGNTSLIEFSGGGTINGTTANTILLTATNIITNGTLNITGTGSRETFAGGGYIDGNTTNVLQLYSTNINLDGIVGVLETGASPTYRSFFQGGNQTANITYTLPATAPTAVNQTLTVSNLTNNVLTWTNQSASGVTTAGSDGSIQYRVNATALGGFGSFNSTTNTTVLPGSAQISGTGAGKIYLQSGNTTGIYNLFQTDNFTSNITYTLPVQSPQFVNQTLIASAVNTTAGTATLSWANQTGAGVGNAFQHFIVSGQTTVDSDSTGNLTFVAGANTTITTNNTAKTITITAGGGSGGTPGGSDTQVQYNNEGAFAGDAGMTYAAATDTLSLAGRLLFTGNVTTYYNDTESITSDTNGDFKFSSRGALNFMVDVNSNSDNNFNVFSHNSTTVPLFKITDTGNITMDNTTFTLDAVNNRIGIGTATPSNTSILDVRGNTTVNGTVSLVGTGVGKMYFQDTDTAGTYTLLQGGNITGNITQTMNTANGTIAVYTNSSINKIPCWKTATTLGYCSDAVNGTTFNCTCN